MTEARNRPPAEVLRWRGDSDSVGTVCVVGLGKIGLPLAAQYASSGWRVVGVDTSRAVVESVNAGRSHIAEEPGLAERIADAHAAGMISATSEHALAAREADVVVMIVPLVLTADHQPRYDWLDAASGAVAAGLRPGTLVVYETTLPIGDTRRRFGPMLARQSGLTLGGEAGFDLAFSPERVFSGRVFRDLAEYPKLVGGTDERSAQRATAFYRSVLSADVWTLDSSEAAEFAKLAETTYRDVNIALANEFAGVASRMGVDIGEVIRGANSQPFSHIHQPGIGVGGHCIPVYPNFLLAQVPDLTLVRAARNINDSQVIRAIEVVEENLAGGLDGSAVLVLGLTYREHVHEVAYSRALPLIESLRARGADVWAYDPLMDEEEILGFGARPYEWGTASPARAIMTQTADPSWQGLEPSLFPLLSVVFDGRNSLPGRVVPPGVKYIGVGRDRPGA